MNFQEWIDKARDLEAEIAASPSIEKKPLTVILCRLHLLACEAPLPVQAAYERLAESQLRQQAARRIEAMTRGIHRWTLPNTSTAEAWMSSLAAQIRAVDELLYTTAGTDFGDPDSELEDWRCSSTKMLVVPRPKNLPESRLNGRPYLKRGTLRHRLLPPEVGGLEIVPVRIDLRALGTKSGIAASLFSNLQLATHQTREGNFIADGIAADDVDGTLANHIRRSMEGDCAGIVWPELTIDPEARRKICELLRQRIVEEDELPLHWVLAGSWHEETGTGYVNRARVLDGYGRELKTFDKIVPARDEAGRLEDIKSGEFIPVVITDHQVIAMAICRDFCDRASVVSPYLTLQVDFFVVPSMGEKSTMLAHLNVAAEVQAKTGARALVVQQTDARLASENELGYVLPMPQAPAGIQVNSLKSKAEWQSVSE